MKLSIKAWLALLAIGSIVFIGLGATTIVGWEYSNSSAFCSEVCHTAHPEEPAAYASSVHANVACVECHLGRVSTLQALLIKATHMRHLWAMARGFERPMTSYSMRTSSDSCERCHTPGSLHKDSYLIKTHYSPDENNTETQTHLLLHTGGGSLLAGQGKGIHWHIHNQVRFVASDPLKQTILWVEVTHPDGRTVTYQDEVQPLSPARIAKATKRTMDCLDCHNRVGHPFNDPEEELDQAIAQGLLDRRLPFVKAKAMDLLNRAFVSTEDADLLVEQVRAEYENDYAWIAATRPESIAQAEEFMKGIQKQFMADLMRRQRFDTGPISWMSFPDNGGHTTFAGCFRCHDGKHRTAEGDAIPLDCNLCHNIPVIVREGEPPPDVLALSDVPQPDSHGQSSFILEHPSLIDESCESCHGEIEFGSDGQSFCSNPACHGRNWPNLEARTD